MRRRSACASRPTGATGWADGARTRTRTRACACGVRWCADGVCYAQMEGRMNMMITTWRSCEHTSAAKFRDVLVSTLIDMRNLGANLATADSKL